MSNIIEFAKRFAGAGFYVFPLYSSNQGPKKPYGWALNNVKEDVDKNKIIPATTDLDIIHNWKEIVAAAYDGAEVVSFGVLGKGVIIFDIDLKNGKRGDISYDLLRKSYKLPPAKLKVKSKSGGYHLYFAKSKRFANTQIKSVTNVMVGGIKYEGVDIRGDGGMVIGPTAEGNWEPGVYTLIEGDPSDELSVCPDNVTASLVKSSSVADLDAMTEYKPVETSDDILEILKRGEIPPSLPNGQRNEGFFLFIHALKNRGLPRASVRALCESLKEVTENAETLSESVNIDDMLSRAYSVDVNNPYDVARDAIDHGFYQIMGMKKLHYILVNSNPYIPSKNIHDESSMKTLFARHAREVVINDKKRMVNPIEVMVRILPDANKVDVIGFKPGAGDVYTNSEDTNGKIYLNTYQKPFVPSAPDAVDNEIYDDFCLLVSRIFGAKDTEEYQLGMDFVAWLIQQPNDKIIIAPYIMSEVRGVGKSLFFNLLAKIFGNDKMGGRQAHMVKIEEITGRFFNPAGRLLNLLDEVQFPVHKDMRRESSTFWRHLKTLVTSETVPVEFKGGDTFQMPNTAAYILAGNTGSNFPMEEYDRRIWLINNNPPEMTKGTIDRLYSLSKGMTASDEARRLIHSLRYHLQRHQIQIDLSTVRAPMSELKREMMLNSMTNEDEWFYLHFEDRENILAKFPVISKSALVYLLETSDTISKSRWQNDAEGLFREYKRKSMIRPIRAKNNFSLSRQFSNLMVVNSMGDVYNPGTKEVLYTTRDHGSMDMYDSDEIIQMFIQNLQTIKQHKERAAALRKSGGTNISAENLSNMS